MILRKINIINQYTNQYYKKFSTVNNFKTIDPTFSLYKLTLFSIDFRRYSRLTIFSPERRRSKYRHYITFVLRIISYVYVIFHVICFGSLFGYYT